MDQSESNNSENPEGGIESQEDASNQAPTRRRGRIMHSLRSLLQRSVSVDVVDFSGNHPVVEQMELNSSDSSENVEYFQPNDENSEQFNKELPTEHAYLGQMDAVLGLDFFECNKIYRIPIFEHHSFVFPGEMLPMIWTDAQFDRTEHTSDGFTFGLVFWDPTFKKKVGVTCQVYERGVDSHGNVTLKCRAHQRFVVVKQQSGSYLLEGQVYSRRRYLADVKIQPEVMLPNPLQTMMGSSLKTFVYSSTHLAKIYRLTAATSHWPKFVYDQVDIGRVLRKVERFLAMLKIDSAPTDLSKLSFWLARNVPISEQKR